jgi:hypothetical protein
VVILVDELLLSLSCLTICYCNDVCFDFVFEIMIGCMHAIEQQVILHHLASADRGKGEERSDTYKISFHFLPSSRVLASSYGLVNELLESRDVVVHGRQEPKVTANLKYFELVSSVLSMLIMMIASDYPKAIETPHYSLSFR